MIMHKAVFCVICLIFAIIVNISSNHKMSKKNICNNQSDLYSDCSVK